MQNKKPVMVEAVYHFHFDSSYCYDNDVDYEGLFESFDPFVFGIERIDPLVDRYQIHFNHVPTGERLSEVSKAIGDYIYKGLVYGKPLTVEKSCGLSDAILSRLFELEFLAKEDGVIVQESSLKGAESFLSAISIASIPSITLSPNGEFNVSWRESFEHKMIVSIRSDEQLDYVIFQPSRFLDERIVLNGSMSIPDFCDYVSRLGIAIHADMPE